MDENENGDVLIKRSLRSENELCLFISEAVNGVNNPVAIFPEVMACDGRDT